VAARQLESACHQTPLWLMAPARPILLLTIVLLHPEAAGGSTTGGDLSPATTTTLLPFKFERPVLIGESPPASVTGANFSHFWFPEAGAVIGNSTAGGPQAVVAGVRFNGDGSKPLPLHTYESLVSWDAGATWGHLGWTPAINGVPTHRDETTGDLIGSCCFTRSADNRSFTGSAQRTRVLQNKTIAHTTTGTATYSGFPFAVARFTYAGAMVPVVAGGSTTLAQTVAFSFKMNEVGGADEVCERLFSQPFSQETYNLLPGQLATNMREIESKGRFCTEPCRLSLHGRRLALEVHAGHRVAQRHAEEGALGGAG
jgi:hypothetical protein